MTTDSTFQQLALMEPLQEALREKNYTTPSPIQLQAIPHLLEGRDLVGCAQTGTGKTAAFALPILQRLALQPAPRRGRRMRALILTPTRELAAQIGESFATYGSKLSLRHAVVFGGVGQNPQVKALDNGLDILVATPGRLLDLIQQKHAVLDSVEVFVLDEADRMLDMGFVHDVKKIMSYLPPRRQSLLFSATMPAPIQEIADRLLHDPVRVEVAPVATTAERIRQEVCFVEKSKKRSLLIHLLNEHPTGLVLVFVRMKHGANKLVEQLARNGIAAAAIHGNKSQTARERALEEFRAGKVRVLIATDIAARGIDVKGISLVINFDIPNEPESYVHRIGRTARAGADGIAISLCDGEERAYIRQIEKLIRQPIPVRSAQPFHCEQASAGVDKRAAQLARPKPLQPRMPPARPGRGNRSGRTMRSGHR